MPANIDMTTGKAAIAYIGETPWHGMGQRMDEDATLTEWQTAAGLNFNVESIPALLTPLTGRHAGMDRAKLVWTPRWEGEIAGYAHKQITKHLWRLTPYYEHADAMQEAWLVYRKLTERYPDVIEPAHFMALFATSLSRHLINMSRKRTSRHAISIDTVSPEGGADAVLGGRYDAGFGMVDVRDTLERLSATARAYAEGVLDGSRITTVCGTDTPRVGRELALAFGG